jgi:hypothetical protein
MKLEILNAEGNLDPSGWLHLIAFGRVPVDIETADGRNVHLVQVYDRDGVQTIVNNFRSMQEQQSAAGRWSGLLLDWDHFSSDTDKTSEAAGWIMDVEMRDDGLWGRIDWSEKGREAVVGKAYKFASVTHSLADAEMMGDGDIRPLSIKKAALTNEPRNRLLKPYDVELVNRAVQKSVDDQKEADSLTTQADSAGAENAQEVVMDYKAAIIEFLGIPADSSDEAISAALLAHKSKMGEMEDAMKKQMDEMQSGYASKEEQMQNRIKALETALVESDMIEHKDVIANADTIREALLKNRDATLAVLKSVAKPSGKLLHNRGAGPVKAGTDAQLDAVNELRNRDKISFDEAWDRARREKPELFK